MEPDKTLKDSAHAYEALENRDDEQGNEEEEDIDEEEVEMTPKEPFERVWQGKIVLKAIEGGVFFFFFLNQYSHVAKTMAKP